MDVEVLNEKFKTLQINPKYAAHYQMAKDIVKRIRRENGEGFFTRVSDEGKEEIKKAEDAMFVKLVGKYETKDLPNDIRPIVTEFKDKFTYPLGSDNKPERKGFFSALFTPISFVTGYNFGAEFKEDFDKRVAALSERALDVAKEKSAAEKTSEAQKFAADSWNNNKDFIEVARGILKAGIIARGGLTDDSMKTEAATQAIDAIAIRLIEHFNGSRGELVNNFHPFSFEKESSGAGTNGLSKLPSIQKLGKDFGEFLQFNGKILSGIDGEKLRNASREMMLQKFADAKKAVTEVGGKVAKLSPSAPIEFPQSDYEDVAKALVKAGIRENFKGTTIQWESAVVIAAIAKISISLHDQFSAPKLLRTAFEIGEEKKIINRW